MEIRSEGEPEDSSMVQPRGLSRWSLVRREKWRRHRTERSGGWHVDRGRHLLLWRHQLPRFLRGRHHRRNFESRWFVRAGRGWRLWVRHDHHRTWRRVDQDTLSIAGRSFFARGILRNKYEEKKDEAWCTLRRFSIRSIKELSTSKLQRETSSSGSSSGEKSSWSCVTSSAVVSVRSLEKLDSLWENKNKTRFNGSTLEPT